MLDATSTRSRARYCSVAGSPPAAEEEPKQPQCTLNPRARLKASAAKKVTRSRFVRRLAPGSHQPKISRQPRISSVQGRTMAVRLMRRPGRIW